jgi:hypothetical protein
MQGHTTAALLMVRPFPQHESTKRKQATAAQRTKQLISWSCPNSQQHASSPPKPPVSAQSTVKHNRRRNGKPLWLHTAATTAPCGNTGQPAHATTTCSVTRTKNPHLAARHIYQPSINPLPDVEPPALHPACHFQPTLGQSTLPPAWHRPRAISSRPAGRAEEGPRQRGPTP